MSTPSHPLLTALLAPLGLEPGDAPPDAARWQAVLAAIERGICGLQLELEDSRRAYRYSADALTRATLRLRDERDQLESRVGERTAQLEQSRSDLMQAQRLAGLGSWSVRMEDGRVDVSEQFALRLGMDPAAPPANVEALLDYVVEDDRKSAHRAVQAALREPGRFAGELRVRDARGEVRWFSATIASQSDPEGRISHLHGAMLDVTARRLAELRTQRLALQDELTGLPNRTTFKQDIAQAVERSRVRRSRFALLFLDLDGFKEINDSLGHDAGDDLLKQVAARIGGCLRKGDRLARFGGDEFLVLIDPVRRRRDVETVTRKILAAVATPITLDGMTATVSASIGIAMYPEDGDDPRRLLKNADAAMYQAKQDGRNALRFYAPRINASLREKVSMVNDLRAAVAHGELGVAYQPIVDGNDGRVLGIEALARWEHVERGAIGPSVFVPLAEETGLIGAVGAQVLARSCAQQVDWDSNGRSAAAAGGYLSVNVSPVQLRSDGFVRELRALLADTGLPATRLPLELTEGTVMADPERAARVLGELAAMGVRIALDDFGTGHSSLAYLRTFPIHCIKIDRVFVSDLGRGGAQAAIVPAIVAIARSLGAEVVAEGVETDAQREALLALGCRAMKGYLFSRPLPPEACGARFFAPMTEAAAG